MKKAIYITMCLLAGRLWGQNPTISPQVINSAGDHRPLGTTGIYVTDNIGEPFTETLPGSGMMITQGFIQPEVVTIGGFSVTSQVKNVTCFDKNDGEIYLKIIKSPQAANYEVTYSWTPTSTCTAKCDSLLDLMAQTYSVSVLITYTNMVGSVKMDTIRQVITVAGTNELCKIKIFNGITTNGDGNNDVFTIENIEEFPKNHITIFNRWGHQVADIKGYNNKTNPWPTKDKLDNLLPSTYFYILDLGDGSKQIKGWVELIKN